MNRLCAVCKSWLSSAEEGRCPTCTNPVVWCYVAVSLDDEVSQIKEPSPFSHQAGVSTPHQSGPVPVLPYSGHFHRGRSRVVQRENALGIVDNANNADDASAGIVVQTNLVDQRLVYVDPGEKNLVTRKDRGAAQAKRPGYVPAQGATNFLNGLKKGRKHDAKIGRKQAGKKKPSQDPAAVQGDLLLVCPASRSAFWSALAWSTGALLLGLLGFLVF